MIFPVIEIIVSGIFTEYNYFHYGAIEYSDTDFSMRDVLVTSSLINLSRNAIPMRLANVSDTTKSLNDGEELATCIPATFINRNCQTETSNFHFVNFFRVQP